MINETKIVKLLSKHLFWDIDISEINDQKHQKFFLAKNFNFLNNYLPLKNAIKIK